MRLKKAQKAIVSALEDIKAYDIEVFDARKLTSLFDFVIIASADSTRQARALANHVRERLKDVGGNLYGVEGEQSGEWVLIDCGDTVVHIMQPAVRAHYNLEELWGQPKARARGAKTAAKPRVKSARISG